MGTVCAGAFLARIEGVMLVPVCVILGWKCIRARPRRGMLLILPPFVVILAYLAWNRAVFGVWLPVSALVKLEVAGRTQLSDRLLSLVDIPWIGQEVLCRAFGQPQLFSGSILLPILNVILMILLATGSWVYRRPLVEVFTRSGSSFLLASAVIWIVANKSTISYLERWNRVILHLATAVVLGAILSIRAHYARAAVSGLLILALARMPWQALRAKDPLNEYAPYRHRAAVWLRDNTKGSLRIGSWNAGMLGYFSHRHVVNLDGLVNNPSYLEKVIQQKKLQVCLQEEKILWLADQACGPEPRPRIYLARTGSEDLDESFQLVAVFYRENSPDGCPGYAVWRQVGEGVVFE